MSDFVACPNVGVTARCRAFVIGSKPRATKEIH
jgi:hypothetical protein